jgi:ketosteroid isomerase-like protein
MLRFAMTLALAADGGTSSKNDALAVVAAQVRAWNRGDLDGFCAGYAENAVFLAPLSPPPDGGAPRSDGLTRGRAEVLARYKRRYPDARRMGRLSIDPADVRATSEAVSVAARWTLAYEGGASHSGHTLIVLVRTKDGWQIVQDASF